MSDLWKKLATAATVASVSAWMESTGWIAKSNGDVEPVDECNVFQREVSHILKYCQDNKRPARIIILKPRRRGSSTVSVAAGYRRLQARRATGCIAGGAHFQGKKLFKMLELYANHDRLDPASCNVLTDIAKFRNGSEMDRITLANPTAGRAGGYQYLCITEMAFLSEEGVADAASVVSGLIKTVQYVEGTIIILESTANGASGDFYERYQNAISFEDFKAGRNGFIKVFYPWFAFPDLVMPPESEGISGVEDMDAEEIVLMERHSLSLEQVAWMRYSIREECNRDFDKFREDYPFDEESAFLNSGRSQFDMEVVNAWARRAKYQTFESGFLSRQEHDGQVGFHAATQGGDILIYERPKEGFAYMVACDPATGKSQTVVADPDASSILVFRQAYIDSVTREAVPAKLVARVVPPCFDNPDQVAGHIDRLSAYYGRCIVALEVNQGLSVLEYLKNAGVPLYQRIVPSAKTNSKEQQYGFKLMSGDQRKTVIDRLTAAIREDRLDIPCPHVCDQLRTFVVDKNGRAAASSGHHDDDVMCLAMAWEVLPLATTYRYPVKRNVDPPDMVKPGSKKQGWRVVNNVKRGW
jgi:hypothetical protein